MTTPGKVPAEGTSLVPVSLAERKRIENIRLAPDQEQFSGAVDAVFDELKNSRHPSFEHPLVLVDGQEEVGFFILKERQAMPVWAGASAMTLHSLRIRSTRQAQGFGQLALMLAVRWIRENRPHVTSLTLAVNARNSPAISLYRKFGFTDTGVSVSGPIGRQLIFSLKIPPSEC